MSDPSGQSRRRDELLAGRVLGDLTEDELAELQAEAWTSRDQQTLDELETTMARVQIALQQPIDEMPIELRTRILRDAATFFQSNQSSLDDPDHEDVNNSPPVTVPTPQPSRAATIRETIAWIACAASLLLALGIWYANIPPAERSLAQQRDRLISTSPDLIRVPWSEGKHPFDQPVQGDVVWSNDQQMGYMRFVHMPVNEPTQEQYQLWIIDPARDDEPIDGGVFDINESGEVIIPINAKLPVLAPAAFAITVEKPGGVVVSTQERLPLLAALQ
ncbi:anti-sigma factor [Neorhodopirellula pilleata]|uniref:Anti-sigma-K factor rskA n=1 Tax=Neorhodopirellula pilleata TaxID=2714738 RepID=A0A5C6A7R2_9BACT|nr:anti-sigma factor [Neorhodopirellula pilleata]TWT95486.1 Anti-sigma-K factor rskA [Neorhodopirellula pilleata]